MSPCRAHAVLGARRRLATPRRGGVGARGHSALATLPLTGQQLRGERAANGAPRRGVCIVLLPGEFRTQARQLGMTRRGWGLGRVASEYQFLGGKKQNLLSFRSQKKNQAMMKQGKDLGVLQFLPFQMIFSFIKCTYQFPLNKGKISLRKP